MEQLSKKAIREVVKQWPKASFKNEYGEEFRIYSNGTMVVMDGDETGGELIDLFSEHFNIWSKDELYKLGQALQEVSGFKP